jgi:hypothetical protein
MPATSKTSTCHRRPRSLVRQGFANADATASAALLALGEVPVPGSAVEQLRAARTARGEAGSRASPLYCDYFGDGAPGRGRAPGTRPRATERAQRGAYARRSLARGEGGAPRLPGRCTGAGRGRHPPHG